MTWGLALSGGAALGMANAGVLKALDEEGLRPDCIAGSSMGAIIAALYALGYREDVFQELAEDISLFNIVDVSPKLLQNGLHGGLLRQRIREHLNPLIGDAYIADCEIPFVCIAGRVRNPLKWHRMLTAGFSEHILSSVEHYIFPPETPVLDALCASSAIPVLFSPVQIGENEFVDLCNFGAIPARSLRDTYHPDVIIATDTTVRYEYIRRFLPPEWHALLQQSAVELEKSRTTCDLLIEPVISMQAFRFDKARQCMQEGYDACKNAMKDIKQRIKN